MIRWHLRLSLVVLCLLALPHSAPAPLIYRPGEGWIYEPVGSEGKWRRTRAKDQLEVAQAAFDKKDYSLALRAARHVVNQWPLSDYAPRAQYLMGRCYEAKKQDEKAFAQYQKVIEKYPKIENGQEILQRQFEIANRYLAGQWFKLWGLVPIPPWVSSREGTAEMYKKIVNNGRYSDVAPQAQLNIGALREKQSDYPQAVKAYELAADRYHDRPKVAADALYKAGLAYNRQARTAEYDQSTAAQAIATFNDFIALYPDEPRVKGAQQFIASLKAEQARGSYEIARFYEKRHRWSGALVYYNEVLLQDPNSTLAAPAREKIDALKKRTQTAVK
jgi:outer membrane protein assembly factor BamD (BamD/ComL family)